MLAPGTPYSIEVNPRVPERLARLEELADNLWYSWDRPTRELFERLQPALWNAVGQSPKAFLKRIDERRLIEAAADPVFLSNFNRVLSAYDTYHARGAARPAGASLCTPTISLPTSAPSSVSTRACRSIPAASAFSPAITARRRAICACRSSAVGLLYRQGYFCPDHRQPGQSARRRTRIRISTELPVAPVKREDGTEVRVSVELPGRASVGTHVAGARRPRPPVSARYRRRRENPERDRSITYRLYGGDRTTRIEQEIVLGIGGVRALAALGLQADGLAHQRRPRGVPGAGARAHADAGRAWILPARSKLSRLTRCLPRTPPVPADMTILHQEVIADVLRGLLPANVRISGDRSCWRWDAAGREPTST